MAAPLSIASGQQQQQAQQQQAQQQQRSSVVVGGGAVGELVRRRDWTQHPLGPPETWPAALVTAVNLVVNAHAPLFFYWSPRLYCFYNDAAIGIHGARHPGSLGRTFEECWPDQQAYANELRHIALGNAPGGLNERQPRFQMRNGFLEEACFTWSTSPMYDERGQSCGVFVPSAEVTEQVITERRVNARRELTQRASGLRTVDAALGAACDVLQEHRIDTTFALIYLLGPDGRTLELRGLSGVARGHPVAVPSARVDEHVDVWPFAEVAKERTLRVVDGLRKRYGGSPLPGGVFDEASDHAAVCPIVAREGDALVGVAVIGLNPRTRWGDAYRVHIELVVAQLLVAVQTARTNEEEGRRIELLGELDRAKTQFFANISHELRTPLTLMQGALEQLSSRVLVPEHAEHVRLAQRSVGRLHKLVGALLDFSRTETQRMSATFVPTDLAESTGDLASVFRSLIESAGLVYDVAVAPLDEPVFIDADLWEKVLFNLLSNAYKYTLCGRISVQLQRGVMPPHAGGAAAGEPAAVLTVRDTGCGVPASVLPRLFERFYRVPQTLSRARSYEGSGIGLALTRELVRMHGGHIGVASVENEGTTFTVAIPFGHAHLPSNNVVLAPPETTSKPRAANSSAGLFLDEALRWSVPRDPLPEGSLGESSSNVSLVSSASGTLDGSSAKMLDDAQASQPRLLIIDDNADMREYLKSIFSPAYEVALAMDGRDALTRLMSAAGPAPDVVLSDVMMPHVDGLTLVKHVRTHAPNLHSSIVLLSARAGEEARIEGLQSGADDYLSKPFSAKELLSRVAVQVRLARLRLKMHELVQERTHALMESEARYRNLAEMCPVGICRSAVLREGESPQLVYYNQRFVDIVGMRGEDQTEVEKWHRNVHPDDWASFVAAWQRMLQCRQLSYIEFRLRRPGDEHDTWVCGNCSAEVDTEGRVRGYIAALTDVTDLKRAESARLDAVRRAEQDAQQHRRQMEMFVDMICHEIRNPLNGIMHNVDLLLLNIEQRQAMLRQAPAGALPDGERLLQQISDDRTLLASIDVCTLHQKKIADDVLDLSKLTSGNIATRPEPVQPVALVRTVLDMFRGQARAHAVALALDVAEADKRRTIAVDPYGIVQAVMNLVSNAVKFTRDAAERRVTVAVDFPELDVVNSAARLRISVRDTGVGMTADEIASLFHRFRQANAQTYRHYGGSGLGLYLTKSVLDIMGGTIDVHSIPGVGSTFVLTVPVALVDDTLVSREAIEARQQEIVAAPRAVLQRLLRHDSTPDTSPTMSAAPVAQVSSATADADARKRRRETDAPVRVLVVDDNDINRMVLRRHLESFKECACTVTVAVNGKEALDSVTDGCAAPFDLILMDVEMPVMDGLEATRRIRAHEAATGAPRVAIVGVSGNARSVHVESGLQAGMDQYLVKPYRRDQLLELVLKTVNVSPSAPSAPANPKPLDNITHAGETA